MKREFFGSHRFSRQAFTRAIAACAVAAVPLTALFVPVAAQNTPPPPTGQSFLVLDPDSNGVSTTPARFTQELFATTQLPPFSGNVARVLGGIAFAPNGDVWASECLDNNSTLHRFAFNEYRDSTPTAANHMTITPRRELAAVPTQAGCGIVNHPDGMIYSNTDLGVTRLSAATGLPVAWPDGSTGPAGVHGNALGIAVDPQSGHIVYPDLDCDDKPNGSNPPFCTFWELDPGTATTAPSATMFAQVPHDQMPFVDGIYFEPAGNYLFVTNRVDAQYDTPDGPIAVNEITVLRRPSLVTPQNPQVVRHIPMATEPDGIAFHNGGQFLITNDEEGNTMSRFDFPNGFEQAPGNPRTITVYDIDGNEQPLTVYGMPFAQQGFRGDMAQVGADGCIYATQGRDFFITNPGTRYDNGDVTTEDSIVRICATPGNGGFEPPPGVNRSGSADIAGAAYLDVDGDGVISGGDSLLDGVTITLAGAANDTKTTAGTAAPTYSFTTLAAGSYTVTAPAVSSGYALVASTPATVSVTLAENEHRTDVNFLYRPGRLSGSVYLDANEDGAIGAGDTLLSNVPVTLSNGSSTTSSSGPVPTYAFPGLAAGSYTISAPVTANGYRQSISPAAQTLAAGQQIGSLDFLYIGGRISGYAYVDANGNASMDIGETRLAGVIITGPNGATRTTDGNGFYRFTALAANSYTVSAPGTAQNYALTTTSPLPATLSEGDQVDNLNFGFRPGALSGYAYLDANHNGQKEAAEAGLAGVTINGPDGRTQTTDSNGFYEFTAVVSGSYTVSAPATASGYALSTPSPLSASVIAPATKTDVNFGYSSGSLSGHAYVDRNANNVLDAGDTLLAGVSIAGPNGQSRTTDAAGFYEFTSLAAGNYALSAPGTASGFGLSTPSPLSATLAAGAALANLDFGYRPGSLSGFAYVDANSNGQKDSGEPVLQGVVITLAGNGTTTTDVNGAYSFASLTAANYSLSAPTTAGGYGLTTPSPLAATLPAGGSLANLNFGYRPGSISGFAYVDSNLNGVKDGGEAGLPGVTITFGSQTRVTDGTGFYVFGNLLAGGFVLTAPSTFASYLLNTPASLTGVLPAAGTVTDQNFGYKLPPPVTPTMTIRKTASTATYSRVGQTITYTYTVTNTGTVQLTGPFTVVDDKLGSFTCGAATATLAPGASLSCTKNYVIQSSDLGNVVSLPTGVPANVDTGQWLAGNMSTQDTLITNAGGGVPNGLYPGWCIQDYVVYDLHNQPGTLYSTIGGNLPPDLAAIQWGKVNWVLNHKRRAPGATNVQFFKDVQTAVWVSVGEPNPEFGISPTAQQMIDEANQHVDYVPGIGDVVAVVIYSDGMTVFPGSIQESIIEMKLLQSITNDAYVTVSFNNTTVSSPHTQVTVNQVYEPPYVTFTQGGWGATPSGNNPAMLLKNNFASVYPSGVTIGITGVSGRYYLKFTSSTAVLNFLPAGGTPKPLKASATNPTTSGAGTLAGQVLALRLSVDFSAAGKITTGLGALKIAPGNPLAGQTVLQVLALANQVLGGNTAALPAGMSVSGLNDVVTRINENFDNGTTNNGYLVQ